jgi:carbon starvation protein
VVAVWVFTRNRNPLAQIVPLTFLLAMTTYALFLQLGQFLDEGEWLLLVIDAIIFVLAVWLIIEALAAFNRARGVRARARRGTNPE